MTYKIVPDDSTLVAQIKTHEIDMAARIGANVYPEASNVPGTIAVASPTFEFDHVDFNLKRPIFADVRLRRALEMGVDRKAILAKIAHGLGDASVVPDSPRISADYNPNAGVDTYDPAKARAALDALGWKPGPDGIRVKNGQRLAFDYATQTESVTGRAIEGFVQAEWHDLGVDVSVKNQPTAQFFDNTANGVLQGGKYDVAGFAWVAAADPDDSTIYNGNNFAPNGQNALFWNDPIANRAMNDGLSTIDAAKRKADSFAEQRQFALDVPSIVLYFRREAYVYNSDLKGFSPSPVISSFWNPQDLSVVMIRFLYGIVFTGRRSRSCGRRRRVRGRRAGRRRYEAARAREVGGPHLASRDDGARRRGIQEPVSTDGRESRCRREALRRALRGLSRRRRRPIVDARQRVLHRGAVARERRRRKTSPENVTYWKLAHGIRFSAMPAFGSTLSSDQLWQLTMFLSRMDKLPAAADAAWKRIPSAAVSPAP